jgi:glycolate oxidase iron-sulfur subunit
LQSLVRATGILRLMGLSEKERLLPPIDKDFFFSKLGRTYPAVGQRRARVALFAGCVAQVSFSALHDATIRVLTANGCEVVVPSGQTCCGALAGHAGVRDVARSLARVNLDVFLAEEFDAVITNAAGCGSTLKEYEHLFAEGTPEQDKAHAFRKKMRDVTEFLAELGLTAQFSARPMRVTYQDSCHLLHGQKVREAPRKLLRSIPGLELTEMAMADYCCGSAGSYNVTETETSLALLAEKMKHARATNAPVIVTANPGCLLQMRGGAEIHSTGQEVVHVMELLDRALVKKS